MKKILFIIPRIPYPLSLGGNQAFFNMADHLRQTMEVSLLLTITSSQDVANVRALQQIWPDVTFYLFKEKQASGIPAPYHIRHPWMYKQLEKIRASATRKLRRRREEGAEDLVREKSTLFSSIYEELNCNYTEYVATVSRKGFDIIQVEFYELLSLVYVLPPEAETIFLHHELRYIRNENELRLLKQITPRDRMLLQIAKDYERGALNRYKHIITLTETDRQLLTDFLGGTPSIYASPAVVTMPKESNTPFVPATEHRLTFVGSGDHFPNLNAMTWFCKEVVPYLHQLHFPFTMQVIGQWSRKQTEIVTHLCPELRMMGYVEDLSAFMKGSISLIPIHIGSGMRMKILDTVLAKIPFITTTKGVEGIDLRNGEECLVADDAKSFAEAIVTLSKDTTLQERMTKNATERLKQLYDPQKMLERRATIYHQITGAL